MVAIKDFEMPKSCLMCRKRKVLHIDGKHYQLCGLCEDGYLTESWFKDKDLTEDFISPNCPLVEIKEPEEQNNFDNAVNGLAMLTQALFNQANAERENKDE